MACPSGETAKLVPAGVRTWMGKLVGCALTATGAAKRISPAVAGLRRNRNAGPATVITAGAAAPASTPLSILRLFDRSEAGATPVSPPVLATHSNSARRLRALCQRSRG